jgi:hypothetical protein
MTVKKGAPEDQSDVQESEGETVDEGLDEGLDESERIDSELEMGSYL